MTDEIDLDELDVAQDDGDGPNRGDWFWSGEGDPDEEPTPERDTATVPEGDTADTATADEAGGRPVPHVPREGRDESMGIPAESGDTAAHAAEHTDAREAASGPHGGGVDEMAMAVTYDAARQFADPQRVFHEARGWADWIGIVGDVEAFVIKKFQRDNSVDADFFNGAGQAPAERLADIDERSMFYSERLVLVGRPDDEPIARRAGWEFVPLADAAEKADWELTEEGR